MWKSLVDYAVAWMFSVAVGVITVVAYLLLSWRLRGSRPQLHGRYSTPGWNYRLKCWWAYQQLKNSHTFRAHLAGCCGTMFASTQQDEELEKLRKLSAENSEDSMTLQGADLQGNCLVVRLTRMRNRMAAVWVQLQLQDGTIYQLPDHPNTVLHNQQTSAWSAAGLRLQMCEPLLRWRISFNGLLRRGIRHEYCANDGDLEHVRFSFIWTSCSHVVLCRDSISAQLLSEAVAREQWKDGRWTSMAREVSAGYDQWGVLQGVACIAGEPDHVLYLRGLRQRRWDREPQQDLHRSVSLVTVQDGGLMVALTAVSYRYGLSHVLMGHVLDNKGNQFLIDSCNFSLPNFGEEPNSIPMESCIKFSAGGRRYELQMTAVAATMARLYCGWPWTHITKLLPLSCILGNSHGAGFLHCCYRYNGTCPVIPPARINILVESCTTDCPLVVSFADEACRDSSCVGGKAASLALLSSLQDKQVVVPPGLCLTVAAFQEQLRQCGTLREALSALEDVSCGRVAGDLKAECGRTVHLFENTAMCGPVRDTLLQVCRDANMAGPCAVRSSAVGEDSEETSAAGQNLSLLGVRGDTDIVRAVQKCWASYFSFQSVQYRRQHGQVVGGGYMGVVVQQMATAHSAGVMFTVHPVSGDPRLMLITANYGLGESVVSAEVEPDSITLQRERNGTLVLQTISTGSKSHKITMAGEGGVVTQQLDEAEAHQLSISTEQALALGRLGLRVEAVFGAPRDIEWAICQDVIYVLQARPITSLDVLSEFELLHEFDTPKNCDPEVFSTANVGEVMPGAMSALSLSTLLPALNAALEQAVLHTHFRNVHILCISYCHVFINVLMSTLLRVGDRMSLALKVMEIGIFGHAVVTPQLFNLAVDRNGTTGHGGELLQLAKMSLMFLRSKKHVTEANRLASQLKIDTNMGTAEVLYESITGGLHVMAQVALLHSLVTGGNTFIEIVLLTVLMEGKEEFAVEHYSDISLLLSSCSEVVSADVPSGLKDVARLLWQGGHMEEFCHLPPDEAYSWLQDNAPAAATRLQQFLAEHGHRSIKEFDFATETWGLNPSPLVQSLQAMGRVPFDEHSREVLSAAETVEKLVTPHKKGTRMALRWLLPACRTSVARRESTKSSLVHVIQELRLAYQELGRRLVYAGQLPDPSLVFCLSHYELRQLLNGPAPLLLTKALRRQRLWTQFNKLSFPEIIIGLPVPKEAKVPVEDSGSDVRVTGTPVYPGTVVGRACVILQLDQISQLQKGDVLITHSTDIGWSPYFPALGGVVTELGGIISHGAVVAREYGLPCVVGAQGATSMFHTGDLVLLAGSRGTIERIKQDCNDQK